MQSPLPLPPLHRSAFAAEAAKISLGLREGGCPAAAVGSGCLGQSADTSTKATTKPLPERPKAITKTSAVPLRGSYPLTGKPAPSRFPQCSDQRAGTKLPWMGMDRFLSHKHSSLCRSTLAVQDSAPVSYQLSSDTHSLGGGHFTQIPAPLGNDICCSWKIKGHPRPLARSEPRRLLKSEEETTSELPNAAFELHRQLSHPRSGAGDIHTLGFFSQHQVQNTSPLSYFPLF